MRRDFPLWGDTEVVREGKEGGKQDWHFSTDLRKIFALIFNDEKLQKEFRETVPKYWDGEPEELAENVLHYLLFHELYHPLKAPFSTRLSTGNGDNDNTKIHQAIRRGVLKAEPDLSPLEQVMKVSASQNGVKDIILDNDFFLDNKRRGYVREDIIPVWDVLELGKKKGAKTDFYTVTRFLYGVLFGPETTYAFFEQKMGRDGVDVAERALGALLQKKVQLPKQAREESLLDKVGSAFGRKEEEPQQYPDFTEYSREIRDVFGGDDRYTGIERFMEALGPYIEKDMPQGRPDQQGEGSGASPGDLLQDLLGDMGEEEAQQFLQELTQQITNNPEQFSMGTADSVSDPKATSEELNKLELTAVHEFYKRNHPEVKIIGGDKVGESLVVGRQEYFTLKKSTVTTQDQLAKLNLDHIARFQKRTRLPVLIPLGNGLYRLNEYGIKERDVKSVVYVDSHINVPDVVELYLDSSGSMYHNLENLGFNDGSSWDMLSAVVYGFVDALYQGSRTLNKSCSIRIHNFADKQVSSKLIPVEKFWQEDKDALQVLFKPENGYSYEDITIDSINDGQRRSYVVVTDGNLVISGRTQRESKKMKELAKSPTTDVVLFEIGGTYDLGNAVRSDPNVHYYPVHDKHQMFQNGLEVLLAK